MLRLKFYHSLAANGIQRGPRTAQQRHCCLVHRLSLFVRTAQKHCAKSSALLQMLSRHGMNAQAAFSPVQTALAVQSTCSSREQRSFRWSHLHPSRQRFLVPAPSTDASARTWGTPCRRLRCRHGGTRQSRRCSGTSHPYRRRR